MSGRIDIPLSSLVGAPAPGAEALMSDSAASEEVASGRTFYLETFGCQMNVHDSEKVAGVLLGRGYRQTDSPAAADVVFYNTCSIREKAAHKVFSRLGEFRGAAGEGKLIGVLGCVAQQEGEAIFRRAPWVRMVCGSASYRQLPALLDQLDAGAQRVTGLSLDTQETFETEITQRDNPFSAYVTIIEGCDYACSYCVVPHTRGPQRSRTSASVLAEVCRLARAGYSEVQLLGQTVNSYRDPSPRKMSFPDLLRAVAEIPGIRRVRFTTSHPNDFTREIVAAIDATPALCDHIHLPVQSGATSILRAMRRTYTREQYLEKIEWIRAARRPISITTDVIVGFPGESESDFAESLSLLDAAQYDGVFSFTYSPRPNTSAKDMPGAISEEEKGRRLAALHARQREIQLARNESLVGKRFEVFIEGRHESRGQWTGRTTSNRIVNFSSHERELLGQYRQVEIAAAGPFALVGAQIKGSQVDG
ncbi:MAG TPA: tRNA (N6-isopentenyl adenosine(37)-C2)-methylthiotransferase MiaB [Candidatus Acidoferrales bacterium]|nr:tRNA (N6-isopentenyl adenosine(37)-C2)-methylthiotransferase MiaB [Candidatus Acidoferrales bacterium]